MQCSDKMWTRSSRSGRHYSDTASNTNNAFVAAVFVNTGQQFQGVSSRIHDGCGCQWVPVPSLRLLWDSLQACMYTKWCQWLQIYLFLRILVVIVLCATHFTLVSPLQDGLELFQNGFGSSNVSGTAQLCCTVTQPLNHHIQYKVNKQTHTKHHFILKKQWSIVAVSL